MSKNKEPIVVEMLMGPVCLDYSKGPPFTQIDTTTEADIDGADNPAPISFEGIEVTDNGS